MQSGQEEGRWKSGVWKGVCWQGGYGLQDGSDGLSGGAKVREIILLSWKVFSCLTDYSPIGSRKNKGIVH